MTTTTSATTAPAPTFANFRQVKQKTYNKKQAITTFVNKYKHKFEMKDDAIDLREMAKNFPNEIIPVQDVHDALLTVLGPKYTIQSAPYDPSGGGYWVFGAVRPKIYFNFLEWKDLFVWPIFQRDIAPTHVGKIYVDFDHTSVIVPCIIKLTLKTGEVIHAVWDGHHTIQVSKLKGYTKFPAWIVDVDQFTAEEITSNGMFEDTDEGRILFGCFIAGLNMRRINGLNKRPLSPYDDFLIGWETKDVTFVSMMNILTKNGCVVKRHATCAGAFTQIKSGIECYDLADTYGNKGIFWDRALHFNRNYWRMSHLVLEIFRPMSYLYHAAALQGIALPQQFDEELAALLIDRWGDAESIQEGIKISYWNSYQNKQISGALPEHDKFRVLNGIINYYNQSKGKVITRKDGSTVTITGIMLPLPTCQWVV
jgi:hypothetical protein